jgi:CheY-like chemotaxis protein
VGAHIDFIIELADDVGTMRADGGQLEQVLLNLASNARDAMPGGGTLRIETRVVHPDASAAADLPPEQTWILLVVSDTGSGMSAEVRERIFEPFFTTKERGKGTGLGLALAHAMVEQAGGVVRVDSTPGTGTVFSLYFPRLNTAVPAADASVRPAGQLGGTETILFAEDEDSVRAVATAALERYGYRVLAAADGDSAIAISRTFPNRIDLLLTDVVMPGMNGRQLAETMRRLRPGIPVLFVSGYTDDEALLGDVRRDDQTFLQKPFTTLELVRRIRSALEQPARVG